MENDNKRPMRYYAAIGGTVIGGILTVAGGFYGFLSFAGSWLPALVGLGGALLGAVISFFSSLERDKLSDGEGESEGRRFKSVVRAARNVLLMLGGAGVAGSLIVIVYLCAYFSLGGLVRAAVCLAATAVILTAGIVFKERYTKL